jgi:hypothetical protein
MRLIEVLNERASAEESPFRAQLLREDVARLRKLQELARSGCDLAAFKAAGMRVGWTQGDARTHELREPLEALLEHIFRHETADGGESTQAAIEECWFELHRVRMERLLGCLSTPVPRPID